MDDEVTQVLEYIERKVTVDSLSLAEDSNMDHQRVVGIIKRIECLGNVIKTTPQSKKEWKITEEGRSVADHGSHEALVFNAIPLEGISKSDLLQKIPNEKGSVGFSKAMSLKWIALNKNPEGQSKVIRQVDAIRDTVQDFLRSVQESKITDVPDKDKLALKKRKLIEEVMVKSFLIEKGEGFTMRPIKEDVDVTPEMIASGSWRNVQFKKKNLKCKGTPPDAGLLHPLLRERSEVYAKIFVEMGFEEMATNNYVESSFWNFDALFQPQQHPARDLQDTFFLSDPATAREFPSEYLKRVKDVHSRGGYGSQGYRTEWKVEEAKKNVLRTHTTAVSARMLHRLAEEEVFRPVKYFSIDRVFRNETLDATHLAEFHQIEGLVADRGLSLGHLMKVLEEFFLKLGMSDVRFKPAYNPYTEPSMEVFAFHPGLDKWVEGGNSGMFRPEVLLPLGLPSDVNVIAWGLSLERPTMIKHGINNIRDLFGHKVNLQKLQESM